ncbi:prepilin-type N-terminal cleavage/methylation domain-containing protein [Candidatus Saccharibacteria bacterium]|nr:prepilin-type N-terminal cleavage/methylation domain-containing protein [Candidatus Saccharibacteria bacterium]
MKKIRLGTNSGFTIVELLVVIVVIGILAAITIVSYSSISQRATEASLKSDLSNATKQIELFKVADDSEDYPGLIDDCPSPASGNLCLLSSNGSTYDYEVNNSSNPKAYTLIITDSLGNTSYYSNSGSAPIAGLPSISCETGYIVVPGSATYGTNDFCVMKYEAKIQGNDNGNQAYNSAFVPESRATGTPWVNISQTNAIAEAATACTGCHLITEAEWMTIAQNVLSVASNWSGGTVGNGYIYSGHNDSDPANALAISNTEDGYSGTNNISPSNQRRTLVLTNGEVIWDLAGNDLEWTAGTVTAGQPGVTGGGLAWREWTAITNPGTVLPNPSPSSTSLPGSNTWTSAKGIGTIFSNADETGMRAFYRGGAWHSTSYAGVLELSLNGSPSETASSIGFRVSR